MVKQIALSEKMYVKLKFASADTCDKKKTQIDVSNKPPLTLQKGKAQGFFQEFVIIYLLQPTASSTSKIKKIALDLD